MIRVLLADDHKILREGLKSLLAEDAEIQVVAEAANGKEAVALANTHLPDVVLCDIEMPVMNGLDTIKSIKTQHPEMKLLVLTQYDSQEYLDFVLRAGASGYVLKETASTELIWAIKRVSEGLAYLSPMMTRNMIHEYLAQKDFAIRTRDVLTQREIEVLQLVGEGESDQAIAQKLGISLKTVQSHRAHIMEKLNLDNRVELAKYALRKGMVDSG